MDIFSVTLLLFFIMDPLGNLPIFISVLKQVDEEKRLRITIREMLIALLILILFLMLGDDLLRILHLKQESVGMSGAIILFVIAIRMIFPVTKRELDQSIPGDEPFIVPMATPLVAGPSTLATIILLSHQYPEEQLNLLLAIFLAWLLSATILVFAGPIMKLIGSRGAIAVERLLGMVLVMLAVQMFMVALKAFLL